MRVLSNSVSNDSDGSILLQVVLFNAFDDEDAMYSKKKVKYQRVPLKKNHTNSNTKLSFNDNSLL